MSDTWVFGYGSLIFRPAFPYAERVPAHIEGFERGFWQASPDHRGTPERPGRVVTLTERAGGRVDGMAYRVISDHTDAVLSRLDHRERAGYDSREISLFLRDGRVISDATIYIARPDNDNFVGESPVQALADHVITCTGPSGDNATYVLRLARALVELQAHDPHVQALAKALRSRMAQHKNPLRAATWQALKDSGDARFPGTVGRIPNFKGAEAAAARLATTEFWRAATRLKCNPDSPHRPVRHRALMDGKVVVMAVPKLASPRPFWILDPARIDPSRWWEASSIVGAERLAVAATPAQVGRIDAVCTGCVAVTAAGARLGKGGGYSDLEYAVLHELGLVGPETPIWTTVHGCQVLDDGVIPMLLHDIALDGFCTPDAVVHCGGVFPRPTGIDSDLLPAAKRAAIPVLR